MAENIIKNKFWLEIVYHIKNICEEIIYHVKIQELLTSKHTRYNAPAKYVLFDIENTAACTRIITGNELKAVKRRVITPSPLQIT